MKVFCLMLLAAIVSISGTVAKTQPVVIELFTSQGCSSCPPADALLAEIGDANPKDVIVLSYHVDYWDYIGWKDPFASNTNTQKQYAYGSQFDLKSVYTPQVVVNGDTQFTGSNSSKMLASIDHYSTSPVTKNSITIFATSIKDKSVLVAADYKGAGIDGDLIYVIAVKEKITPVLQGENRSRKLRNTHIVAGIKELKSTEAVGAIDIPLAAWVTAEDILEVVVYASNAQGRIIAAARKELDRG